MHTTITAHSSRRFARPLVYGLTALALLTLAPREARADNIVVTLDRGFLERAVEDAIEDTIFEERMALLGPREWPARRGHAQGPAHDLRGPRSGLCAFQVPGSRSRCGPADQLPLLLGAAGHRSSIPDMDVDVNFPWYIDVGSGGLTWVVDKIADHFIAKKIDNSQAIKQEVLAKVNETVNVPFTYCPDFNVTSSGDVQVIFGQAMSARTDRPSTASCRATPPGPATTTSASTATGRRSAAIASPIADRILVRQSASRHPIH